MMEEEDDRKCYKIMMEVELDDVKDANGYLHLFNTNPEIERNEVARHVNDSEARNYNVRMGDSKQGISFNLITQDVIKEEKDKSICFNIKKEDNCDGFNLNKPSTTKKENVKIEKDPIVIKLSDTEESMSGCSRQKKEKLLVKPKVVETSKIFTFIKDSSATEDVCKCYCCLLEFIEESDWQLHIKEFSNFKGCFPKKQSITVANIAEKMISDKVNMYKCKICDYESTYSWYLIIHYEAHHSQRRLHCGICPNKVFLSFNYLKRHVVSCHRLGRMVFRCYNCQYSTFTKKYLKQHLLNVHVKEKVTCDLCNSVLRVGSFTRHMSRVHNQRSDLLKCSLCNYSTYVAKYLYDHFRYNHSEKTKLWKCNQCSYKAKTNQQLSKHKLSQHSGLVFKYSCKTCDKVFTRYHRLYVHRQWEHSKKTKFNCSECSYTSNRKDVYFSHLNLKHLYQLEFQCCQCKKVCKSSEHFQNHVYTVHNPFEKTYYCDLCPFKFTTKQGLKMHKETKHDNAIYTCQHCSLETNSKQYLRYHIYDKHNENKPVFLCFYCSFETIYKSYLKLHILRKHM